jgi:hypothetical protein
VYRLQGSFGGAERIPVTGLIVALLAWPLSIGVPGSGIDASWISGLYMAIEQGKDFGHEIVFTYGPLGFLQWPVLWSSGLAALAYAFSAVLYLAFAVTVVGVLQRTIGLFGAAVVVWLYLVTVPDLEQLPLILAVAWCLLALREDRPGFAVTLLAAGGGLLSAFECLIKLSIGPEIFVAIVLAMIGARATRRQWALFAGFALAGAVVLWLLAGQSLGGLPDYLGNGLEIASGYSEAMQIGGSPVWAQVFLTVFAIGLVVLAYFADFTDGRARWAAAALLAVASFASFKYGIVRHEPDHLALALSALLGLFLVIPWARTPAVRPAFLSAAIVLGAVVLHLYPNAPRLDPIDNLTVFGESTELAARPGKRELLIDQARAELQAAYAIDPTTVEALRRKGVSVDPWEVAAAWAYELDWQPLPVFQNYVAYTSDLDRLNAEAIESDDGPQLILRQDPGGPSAYGDARGFQGRLAAWDPPEQNFETVCHFVPAKVVSDWQILRRVPDRCGPERLISEATAEPGETVEVPRAGDGELVVLKLEGAEVEGLEKLQSTLWRPSVRTAVLDDGAASFQLVPGTSGDGLIVSRDPSLDSPGGFSQLPQIRNLAIDGGDGSLHFSFYGVKVRAG